MHDKSLVHAGGFDMDVMNDLEKNRCLVLPSHYDFLSGELRNTDHSAYLGNARLAWNATAELAKAAYVHFSDFPVPKPWLSSNEATAAAAGRSLQSAQSRVQRRSSGWGCTGLSARKCRFVNEHIVGCL